MQNECKDSLTHCGTSEKQAMEGVLKSTNEDVQRAIEGLKEIPDEELQEFLNDEDFLGGLDVVDAWEGDEEKKEPEQKPIQVKEQEQKHPPRDRHRRDGKGSHSRERPKREEKKREEMRRDPNKSTKDIERDKMRTKKDNESKLLAEKEKAIKNLLDSDNVVPPGTEAEAIQSIAERSFERAQLRARRSRERRRSSDRQKSPQRRRTPERCRIYSPRRRTRSPLLYSPDRRKSPPFKSSIDRHHSPYRPSPNKRRSPLRPYNYDHRNSPPISPERRRLTRSPLRRPSWERRTSPERKWSVERNRRRTDLHERRRSRSRERHRSRSVERLRRRASRSPVGRRYSPRRWSRSRSRSVERRTRKRSPFINELARQLTKEAITTSPRRQFSSLSQVDALQPLLNQPPVYQPEPATRPPIPPTPYIHQPNVGPPIAAGPPVNGGTPFMNFDGPPQGMSFEPVSLHAMPQTTYSCGPVMYSQSNESSGPPETSHRQPLLPAPVPSPQPVPAPTPMDHMQMTYNSGFNASVTRRSPSRNFEPSKKSMHAERSSSQSYRNGFCDTHEERLKTPEPPVISDTKPFEKTSLSSLLEASVSAKDSSGVPVLYPGFNSEILRQCEHALRELPIEDPRLKMKGRFFYDPTKDNVQNDREERISNSILLQRNKNKIYWEEEEEKNVSLTKQAVQTHQKICQTDEVEMDAKYVQASVVMVDFESQVYPRDLQGFKEEKKPIMDRLDWNARESYDNTTDYREVGDLRWSLNNSSQRRSYHRSQSPQQSVTPERHLDEMPPEEHNPRSSNIESPMRNRNHFMNQKGPGRNNYTRKRYSPNYRHPVGERDDFEMNETRSNHSRGESPMMLEESDDEPEMERTFQRRTDWHPRGKPPRGRSSSFIKPHLTRGKFPGGRPYRGWSNFRGKY